MTTATKRRRRKARITLPGSPSVQQKPQGRDRTHTHQPAEDARMVVTDARMRQGTMLTDAEIRREKRNLEAAMQIDDEERRIAAVNVIAVRVADLRRRKAIDPLLGTDMGRCIHALTTGEERAACADTWAALSAARENFRARILGKSPHPQAANLAMLPEPMQTDQSLRVDLRTPDERDAAAIRAWQEWQIRINSLPAPQYRWAINGALNGFISGETLWRDGRHTQSGANAVSAIKLLTNPQDRVG